MRFDRFTRINNTGSTPRRLAAAKRAIRRQLDDVPLFPEMVKHHTPEARLEAIDKGRVESQQEWRDRRAADWRKARARWRALPEPLRSGVFRYWQQAGTPGDATYFAGLLHDAEIGRFDPAAKERELGRVRMLGRVSEEVAKDIAIPAWPWPQFARREGFFIQLHVAREISQARAPQLFPPLSERPEYCDPEADLIADYLRRP